VDADGLSRRLSQIPGVVAVCLGGSRARGAARLESDWDFGLYYRGWIDTAAVRALGYSGEVVEPGAWGRLVNGGAWIEVDGARVDLLFRDLDTVEHRRQELVQRAGLREADALLSAVREDREALARTVAGVRGLLGLYPPLDRKMDAVIRDASKAGG